MARVSAELVLAQLSKVLGSPLFANADQSRAMLRFVVEEAVHERIERLKEYTVGAEAMGRGPSFDPRSDTIVRAEASRLRNRLERYYAGDGQADPVLITLPKGSYVPHFALRPPADDSEAAAVAVPAPVLVPVPVPVPAGAKPARPAKWSSSPGLVLGLGLGLVAALAVAVWTGTTLSVRGGATSESPVVQFSVPPPTGAVFEAPIGRQQIAVSPDGTRLAFVGADADGSRVWIRDLSGLDAKPAAGTDGARTVFWSPDSLSVYFSVKKLLKQTDLGTGTSRSVARLPVSAMYAAWRSADELILYVGPRSFYALQAKTGGLRELPGSDMRWLQFLPGDSHFVHVRFNGQTGKYQALVTDDTTQKSVTLLECDSRVQYAPPAGQGKVGHLLFIRGGSLLAQPFDASRLQLVGEPVALAQGITYFSPSASANFSVSNTGVLAYQRGYPLSELHWLDRAGNVVGTVGKPAPFNGTVRLSPDGRRVLAGVWSAETGGVDVWLFNADGGSRRVTFPPSVHPRSVWAPDGTRIAFASTRTGPPQLAIHELAQQDSEAAIMNKAAQQQVAATQIQLPTDWAPDAHHIAYDISLGEEEREVWLADVQTGQVLALLQGPSSQWGASFSPGGTQIAFVSEESGRPEVYVQDYQATPSPRVVGEKRQVSSAGAWSVRWRPDGRELFFVGIDNWLNAVDVADGSVVGKAYPLFRIAGTSLYGTMVDFQFDVTRDGRRFVMGTTGSTPPPPITVVTNWQKKFRVP
jgi:Tol biopolymer transport system component